MSRRIFASLLLLSSLASASAQARPVNKAAKTPPSTPASRINASETARAESAPATPAVNPPKSVPRQPTSPNGPSSPEGPFVTPPNGFPQ